MKKPSICLNLNFTAITAKLRKCFEVREHMQDFHSRNIYHLCYFSTSKSKATKNLQLCNKIISGCISRFSINVFGGLSWIFNWKWIISVTRMMVLSSHIGNIENYLRSIYTICDFFKTNGIFRTTEIKNSWSNLRLNWHFPTYNLRGLDGTST